MYTVISSSSLIDLEESVDDHLDNGWVCQGGLAVGVDADFIRYYQAMIRRPSCKLGNEK